ncbi:hypothetical protein ACFIQF_21460 [Comamonas sp. J-3]|uniref:hypothetical protein n=1 Tax=Comamonas trifloxystrobinivorans TaxID=3350256 RepID=UPI00372B9AEE
MDLTDFFGWLAEAALLSLFLRAAEASAAGKASAKMAAKAAVTKVDVRMFKSPPELNKTCLYAAPGR